MVHRDPLPGLRGSPRDPAACRSAAWVTLTGVAAIYYAVPVGGTAVLAQHEQSTVFWTTAVCVMVSILAEGVSATHLTRRLLN